MSKFLLLTASMLALAAPAYAAAPATTTAAPAGKPMYGTFGFDTTGMDKSVLPGNNFAEYVNGTYEKELVIPADRASYGMFNKLRDLSQERTRTVIETASKTNAAPGSEAQKVGDFYASFMDATAINAKGAAPVKPALDAIAAIQTPAQLSTALGKANRVGIETPFGVGVLQDLKNPDRMAAYMGQGGLGMPDRDYYLDVKFLETRDKYRKHVANMLRLGGIAGADAEKRADAIVDLETKLAKVQWTKVEERQVDKAYNPVKLSAIAAAYPGVDWPALLGAAGLGAVPEIIVTTPSAIAGSAKLMKTEPLAVWKDYLAFHTLKNAAPMLSDAIAAENFAFDGTVLNGTPEDQPRWKRGVDMTTNALGEAVGKLYVADYFPPASKAAADALVKNIITSMDARLAALTWMDPATKVQARAKLAAFTPKIGYPDKWRDYSKLDVVRGDALGNYLRAQEFETQHDLDKLGKPIDRSEWGMTPMTVNAYANPLWNEIVFPAAILQPPFFDPNADAAVNYGGIGAVIGHEISHHFDDQGRKFDKHGALADWWTPQDVERFKKLTDQVVKQYAQYEPIKGTHVNGELTLGENMADLAGITVAYDAYKRSLGGKPAPVIDGYTGDQRFFLGFGQVWRQKYREPSLMKQLTTNPHTPGNWRPQVVRNIDAWYPAFGVKPGEALYLTPEERARVW
ncbi:M13 family peptidase [Polymorphobacter arshaanensis]|uniref:M13 family peptidase n=1 Tax=Glacieibacterium arshaanense TaxID=2511025 RepID=A0A4Y9ERQ9_9SPHN|nr:M13 family metallopeptidase [Polymorphobacter arshaanensis]TFU06040.1 M13 family peptidase [Polymorphobacter arshaanensis]